LDTTLFYLLSRAFGALRLGVEFYYIFFVYVLLVLFWGKVDSEGIGAIGEWPRSRTHGCILPAYNTHSKMEVD